MTKNIKFYNIHYQKKVVNFFTFLVIFNLGLGFRNYA